ncbi:hypothetical protein ACFE04_007570 [Oxalis oulophora]
MAAESITDETPTAKASLLSTTSTTSTCLTSTVNGSHEFFISGYSLTKGMGIGKYIASDCFTVGGFDWQIYFYPDGKSLVDNALYVSLFIALASDIPDVRALFELSLLDQSGNQALMHYIYWDELPNLECLNTTRASTFMAQHLLEAADRYALDRLRMLCESKLCEQLAICTAASMLALADQHHCSQLKIVCLKFIALPDNLKAVMQTDGFEHLQKSCPSVLSELLQYVAKFGEQSAYGNTTGTQDAILVDGSNANARRVKRRTN